jgi:hypothetical protein
MASAPDGREVETRGASAPPPEERVTGLPSFKAMRRQRLVEPRIRDLHYGWTAELIARA